MTLREEAKTAGLTRYFTSKPCLRGHVSERLVSTKTCCQCNIERSRTAERKAKEAVYRRSNAEKIAAKDAAYYKANIEKIAAKNAEYNKTNAEKIAAYRKANLHIQNAQTAKRRAQKLQATPSWADTAAIKAIYEQASFMSKVLGEKQHVDHIIPLQGKKVCGLHVAANLQILSATDNIKKSNKLLPMYEMP